MEKTSVSKRTFWQYVNRKMNRVIHHFHVLSVITILFEEMIADLKAGKTIKIHNLGSLSLNQMKPRKYFDVRLQRVVLSEGKKVLRMKLARIIRNKLIERVNLDTPKGDE